MKLNINVCTNNKCKIVIEDISKCYRSEDSKGLVAKQLKYSETASVVLIEHIKSSGENTIDTPVINIHKKNIEIPIKFDGYFKVQYIVIPNSEWFERELNRESGSALSDYKILYFTDGDYIYKYFPETKETPIKVTAEELLERNPTDDDSISRTESEHVSICYLQKCYVNLCKQIFEKTNLVPCFQKENIEDLIYKRDLVWMTINIVDYLVSLCQLDEAERYIEMINGCNGVCNQQKNGLYKNDCGCCK